MPPNDPGYNQPTLLETTDNEEPTLHQRFVDFIDANPQIVDTMIRLAREWVRSTGRHKLGVNALIERVRWEVAIASNDPSSSLKVNNSYAPYFAREIVRRAPDLEGVFATRSSMADRHYGIVRWPGDGPRLDCGPGAS